MKDTYNPMLSKHFSLSEMTRSATALRKKIDNTPDVDAVEALQELCIHVLEPLRERFGVLKITSGFRSPAVNALVGGSRTSQHLAGEAADIFVSSLDVAMKMYNFVRFNLEFDQMLMEMRAGRVHCLHVSYTARRENRHKSTSYYELPA